VVTTHSRDTSGSIVVKIGGRAFDGPVAFAELASDVRELVARGRRVVLVHGGGAEVTEWCTRLGITPRFHGGLRVSDPATLDVATAVLAGLANKRLVARLLAAGVDAVGLAALDGGIVETAAHPDARSLGAVGAVTAVRPALLDLLLDRGTVPVLASIGAKDGGLLNLNADDLAAGIAPALGAGSLLLLSDTPGLVLGGTVVPALDRAALAATLDHPEVTGGMVPKLKAALAVLDAGVARVAIAAWQGEGTLARLLAGEAIATHFLRTSPEEALHG
jgi:acetylglutamate kinase